MQVVLNRLHPFYLPPCGHQVANNSVDLRVTLVWMDPPVLNFAGRQLLHDLDLIVIPENDGKRRPLSFKLTKYG